MKKIFLLFFIILLLALIIINKSYGSQSINSDYLLGSVTTNNLNLRIGTSTNFESINKLSKGEQVKIYGKIGDWYIVQDNKNQIGVVNYQFINVENDLKNNLSEDENLLLSLINEHRQEENLSPLIIDEDLQNLARLKAKDLVENNYFSHTSPTYGSPFEMIRSNAISYKTASENIAGNNNIEKALESWLNSDAHKKNILSNDFNYTGIGIVDSIAYGKIIVELFIGR